MTLKSVVFPQPLGPRRVKKSPSSITRLTPSTARSAPKTLLIPFRTTFMPGLLRKDDLLPLFQDVLFLRRGLNGVEGFQHRDALEGGKPLDGCRIGPCRPARELPEHLVLDFLG